MTPLSPHFSLEEMTFSTTASRLGLDNTAPPDVLFNLKRVANGLERVRQLINNNGIRISSGFRCKELNAAVKGQPQSQHTTGRAVDFTSTYGTPAQIVRLIRDSSIEFDQLICEFDSWVHISFSDNPRRQVLTIDSHGTRNFTS